MITADAHGHFRFSNDYSWLVFTLEQLNKTKYYECQKTNGQWGFFKEILKEVELQSRTHVALSYSKDNTKLYSPSFQNHHHTIEYFSKTDGRWSNPQIINVFQNRFEFIRGVLAIGNNGLLIQADYLVAKKKEETGHFYSKMLPNGEWTAVQKVSEKDLHNGRDFALTGFKEYFIYSNYDGYNIFISEVPQLIQDEITKSRESSVTQINEPNRSETLVSSNSTFVKPTGEYYAFLIGNSDYELDDLDLGRPVKDVAILYNTLTKYYQFEEENVKTILNSDREEILQELYNLRKKINPDDNLLIFYAGHGHWDEQVSQGYWWPVDAVPDNPSNWLSNSDLREQIRGINSAHTLLISDACFSGGIFRTRGAEEIRNASSNIKLLYRMRSRRAITSGTLSSVPDKSVFFKYLIKYLTENEKKFISSSDLFTTIRASVLSNSLTVPQDGVILNTGDEGGDFIFILK